MRVKLVVLLAMVVAPAVVLVTVVASDICKVMSPVAFLTGGGEVLANETWQIWLCSLALQRRSRRCEHNRFLRAMVKTRFLRLMVVTLSGAVLEVYFLRPRPRLDLDPDASPTPTTQQKHNKFVVASNTLNRIKRP